MNYILNMANICWGASVMMSYPQGRLKQDVINIFGRQIEPITIAELVHKVTNEGYKSQREYTDDEILDVLTLLVETGFVEKNTDNTYQWRE